MTPRRALVPVVAAAAAVAAVAVAGGSSTGARPSGPTALDLVSSAHPTGAMPAVADRAFDARVWAGGLGVSVDTAALTSTTCDGCAGESTSLHVVYADRAQRAQLDNVATAWTQECRSCAASALSVQVVVLHGRPTTVPNNRALALDAACSLCRTAAVAYQVVLVADDAQPMTDAEVAELRAWFDEQAAVVRQSVVDPADPQGPTPTEPTPTTSPTPTPTRPPDPADPTASTPAPRPAAAGSRRVRRDAVSALGALERLLTSALDADAVAADVDVSR